MTSEPTMQRGLAKYLLDNDRNIVDPEEMIPLFPLQTPAGNETAWLEAVAQLLGGAVELRRPFLPSGKTKLAIKDRAVLFNLTQERSLEDMAKDRKGNQDA